MRIVRHPVVSSSIASIGYLEEPATLEIEFRGGAVYRYFGVPASVYRGLDGADSIGRYFNERVRPRFEFGRHEQ